MMRDKSIIAQESLKGSILSFYMKLERQMGNVCTAVHHQSKWDVIWDPRRDAAPGLHCNSCTPRYTCSVPLSAVSHWACCSEMTQLLLVWIALWQWFFPVSKSTGAFVTLRIPEGKKKVNIGVLVFSLKPHANIRCSPLYFWVPTTSFWWVIITFLTVV